LNRELLARPSIWAAFIAGMVVAGIGAVVIVNFAPTKAGKAEVASSSAKEATPKPLIPPAPAVSLAPPNPDPALEAIPWKQRTHEQWAAQATYEDEFTFKHREIHDKDPFIWAISQEFAERFGMPAAWIDPGLKGAYALAWRTTTIGALSCGYGGNPNGCWPPFTCQLDLYVDSKAIPWAFDDIQQDFDWRGLTSMSFVPRRPPADRRLRYTNVPLPNVKGQPFTKDVFKSKTTKYTAGGPFNILYFDRNYAPGISSIGFGGACPTSGANDDFLWNFYSIAEHRRSRGQNSEIAHTVEIPRSFYQKIRPIYVRDDEQSKKSNTAYQEAMERFAPK
jgi:hypothetical protein